MTTRGRRNVLGLSEEQWEMLCFLAECDDRTIAAGLTPSDFWPTDGLGGARVARVLHRFELVRIGNCSDRRYGAKATPAGHAACPRLETEDHTP